jgi:hypothetical protein
MNLPDSPVGHLILLIGVEIRKFLEEKCKAATGIPKCVAGIVCVKKSHDVQAQVSLKPDYVHIRPMEHLHGRRVSC